MNPTISVNPVNEKHPIIEMDKIDRRMSSPQNVDSLVQWANIYFAIHVVGTSKKTEAAKRKDMERFIGFLQCEMGTDHVDSWTPAISRQYQKKLQHTISENTGSRLKATTVNRNMATLRHFGRWLHQQRPFLAGDPLARVKDIDVDAPDLNGLTARQVMRIKAACEQRMKACTKAMQDPIL
jgi:integrase/recombinase XerD